MTAVGLIASSSGNHQAVGKLLLSPTLTMKWAQGSLCHLVAFPKLQFICYFANCTGWARLSHLPRSLLFECGSHLLCSQGWLLALLPSLLRPEITGHTTVPDIMCAGAWTQSLCTLNKPFWSPFCFEAGLLRFALSSPYIPSRPWSLNLAILLPQPLKCWNCRHASPYHTFIFASCISQGSIEKQSWQDELYT